jgi:hypothetical protein
MKTIIPVCLLILLVTACSSPTRQAGEDITLIESYVEAVENMDYETMHSCLADDYLGFGPSYGDSINKEAALENWKYVAENIYDQIDYRRSNNIAVTVPSGRSKGEWVSNWSELHIRYQSGREVTIMANTIYKIENQKIARSYTFYNEADALRQLGFTFIMPTDY